MSPGRGRTCSHRTHLVDLIFKACDYEDLPSLRLMCKATQSNATVDLFRFIDVWIEKESVQKLLLIAVASHLTKHVEHIICGMEEFYVNYDMFGSHICIGGIVDVPRAAYRIYRKCFIWQDAMAGSGSDLVRLSIASKELPKFDGSRHHRSLCSFTLPVLWLALLKSQITRAAAIAPSVPVISPLHDDATLRP